MLANGYIRTKKMTLIKSISGIRGTIGGKPGENLTPIDIVESVSAYGYWLKEKFKNESRNRMSSRKPRSSQFCTRHACETRPFPRPGPGAKYA